MRARSFERQQAIYRAIEAENARASKPIVLVRGKPERPAVDLRDPAEMARAASAALRAS